MAILDNLPIEIIRYVLSFLEVVPPSQRRLFDEPQLDLFESNIQPLKNLSLTCRSLRICSLQPLFRHIKINSTTSNKLLTDFLRDQVRTVPIPSVFLYDLKCTQYTAKSVLSLVQRVMNSMNPERLTIALPPDAMTALLGCWGGSQDSWAFQIPFQIVHFHYPATGGRHFDPGGLDAYESTISRNVLRLRPWTHITFNEGSSVPAYSMYEYFHLTMPTWIPPWSASRAIKHHEFAMQCRSMAFSLATFDIIGVFPFAGSDHGWMKSVTSFLDTLVNLRTFRVQISPKTWQTEQDGAWVNEAVTDTGKIEYKDLWMEFEMSYRHLAEWMKRGPVNDTLERIVVLDYQNQGLRTTLDGCFTDERMTNWVTPGDTGIWEKAKTFEFED